MQKTATEMFVICDGLYYFRNLFCNSLLTYLHRPFSICCLYIFLVRSDIVSILCILYCKYRFLLHEVYCVFHSKSIQLPVCIESFHPFECLVFCCIFIKDKEYDQPGCFEVADGFCIIFTCCRMIQIGMSSKYSQPFFYLLCKFKCDSFFADWEFYDNRGLTPMWST